VVTRAIAGVPTGSRKPVVATILGASPLGGGAWLRPGRAGVRLSRGGGSGSRARHPLRAVAGRARGRTARSRRHRSRWRDLGWSRYLDGVPDGSSSTTWPPPSWSTPSASTSSPSDWSTRPTRRSGGGRHHRTPGRAQGHRPRASGQDRVGGLAVDLHSDTRSVSPTSACPSCSAMRCGPPSCRRWPSPAVDVAVRLVQSPEVGSILSIGHGGMVLDQVGVDSLRFLPLTDLDAERLVDQSRLGPAACWVARARRLVDVVRVAGLAEAVPEVAELLLNPIIVADRPRRSPMLASGSGPGPTATFRSAASTPTDGAGRDREPEVSRCRCSGRARRGRDLPSRVAPRRPSCRSRSSVSRS
jgi:hypothetical protein